VALIISEGAGSVTALVALPGTHLYMQALGNYVSTVDAVPSPQP